MIIRLGRFSADVAGEARVVYFRCGSRLCENYFLATETKYLFMKLAFAATMNRPRYLLDSIIAQKDTASAFSHSLGQKRKSRMDYGMSAFEGRADIIFGRLDVCF